MKAEIYSIQVKAHFELICICSVFDPVSVGYFLRRIVLKEQNIFDISRVVIDRQTDRQTERQTDR